MSPINLLWNVEETASFLGVSTSWVRRRQVELPLVRVGSRLRFDSQLLHQKFSYKTSSGSRVKQKGDASMFQATKTRYQSGRVYRKGKKTVKWYGKFREDRTRRRRETLSHSKKSVPRYTHGVADEIRSKTGTREANGNGNTD